MPKQKLFDEESEEEVSFKTENAYAKKYDTWRGKEEIHKLEQKYGSKALSSDASASSDSEDSSDEPPEVSEETEEQFLKTLALLKTKDPRIYDPGFKFFEEKEEKEQEKPKAQTLTFDDSDSDDDGGNIFTIEKKAEINAEPEQRALKKSDSKKTPKEGKLKDYLIGKADHIDAEVEEDLAPLKALWSDPKLNEGEAFLRDYILDKRYLDDGDAGAAGDQLRDDEDLAEDERRVEEQGHFERAYNFRFEEPDDEYLKRFPRTMNYIRPKDDRRSRARAEVRARKDEERRRRMEEIARLKALKLKEIQEKINRIKEVTGNQELAFEEADVEGDFDPDDHDRRMRAIFDEQYYGQTDEQKPVFPDLDEELEIENWDKYDPEIDCVQSTQPSDARHCEDEDFNMDADYDPKTARANLLEQIKSNLGKKRRNRKKKSKLAALLAIEKPAFVPTAADKTYSQYMEEYYKMDCEDVIGGDLPTRFKYREVVANDFGLSVEEILLADDRELTQWVPLKRLVRHRARDVERSEVDTYARKAADEALKRRILPSLFKDLPEEPEIVVPVEGGPKKKKKKKSKKKSSDSEQNIEHNSNANETVDDSSDVTTKKKKKKHQEVEENVGSNIEDTVIPIKKKKNRQIEESTSTELNVNEDLRKDENIIHKDTEFNVEVNTEVSKEGKRKKKKHKTNGFVVENIQNAEPSQVSVVETAKETKGYIEKVNLKRKFQSPENTDHNKKNKHKKTDNVDVKNNQKKHFKMKLKQKDKFKDNSSDNPLSKLSDERLKAYGLNPKKYRNFLKHKKF